MPNYKYSARDARGKSVRGKIAASDEAALLANLKEKQLFLLSFEEDTARSAGARLGGKELSDFCRELGAMLGSGITLLRAIEIMLKRDIPKKQRPVYEGIYKGLLGGTSLSDSMEEQGKVFPPLLVSMFRAGEANGTMDRTAIRMAEHYEKEYRLQNKVKSATTYPVVLLILTVLILVAVFTFILPRFLDIYGDSELPKITQIVVGISRLFTDYLLFLLAGVLVFAAAISALAAAPAVRTGLDRLKLKIPVFGRLNRTIATARFARTLSSLYASGISILKALEISRGTVGNAYIAGQFAGMIQKVRNGSSLSAAMESVDGFDRKLAATVAIGEEAGRLEHMLLSVADSFDYDSGEAAGRMVSLLEPLLIVVMALLIGTVMIAVMLPIYNMYGTIESRGELPAAAGLFRAFLMM